MARGGRDLDRELVTWDCVRITLSSKRKMLFESVIVPILESDHEWKSGKTEDKLGRRPYWLTSINTKINVFLEKHRQNIFHFIEKIT